MASVILEKSAAVTASDRAADDAVWSQKLRGWLMSGQAGDR